MGKKEKRKEMAESDEPSKKKLKQEAANEEQAEQLSKKEKKAKKKAKKEKKEKKEKEQEPAQLVQAGGDGGDGASNGKKKKKKDKQKEVTSQEAPSSTSTCSSSFTASDVVKYHELHEIHVNGKEASTFAPLKLFSDSQLPKDIMGVCGDYTTPTPIQSQCWPILLAGRDVVGIAQTGSGKTIAFGVPALQHISLKKGQKSAARAPAVLVMAPTRELAIQNEAVFQKAKKSCGVQSICVYGGVSKWEQKNALKGGVDVVVGTPGRLLDLVNEGACDISKVDYLVLDEADRMLDMGFEKDIKRIVSYVQSQRQTVMFSATWPQSIQKIAAEYLDNPIKVTIGSGEESLSTNKRVAQHVEVMEQSDKEQRLLKLLQQIHKKRDNRVLVFALYKKEAARLEGFLSRNGWSVQAIHGDQSQDQRMHSLATFKDGSKPLLVATDVAARGLDIPDVEYVINFTFPLTIEDYVHRIGRTGRAGKNGVSYTFFTSFEKGLAGALQNVLREADQKVPEALLKFGSTVKKKVDSLYGAFGPDDSKPMKEATKITFDNSDDDSD